MEATKEFFQIKIADVRIRIVPMHDWIKKMCGKYLIDDTEMADFTVCTTQEDIDFEKKKSEEKDRIEGLSVRKFSDGYLKTLAVYRKIADKMFEFDTLLVHGSVVAVDGESYLFIAKSGTGKTTHTKLWLKKFGDRAMVVNGDKPLLKVEESCIYACGTPWCGKEGMGTNTKMPLKAVCILERDDVNHIHEIGFMEALPVLLQQSYRASNEVHMITMMDLLGEIGKKVRIYRLGCNMEPEAATVSYEGMQ